MTVPSRGAQARRGGRRPGWMLLTTLLVLAIAASSALVFTSRVELLKLAVIAALWAAVVAAFVSVIYRRQSDADRARARDLKLVYNLQLDREISARREYELTVESRLRRELASELRAQAADELAALRSELTALRTNLEILFDTDLGHRPALENERIPVRAYSDWAHYDGSAATGRTPRDDADMPQDDASSRTVENPIIDVSEVGVPAGGDAAVPPWQPTPETRGDGRWPPQERPPYFAPEPRARPEPLAEQSESRSQPGVPEDGAQPAGISAALEEPPPGSRHSRRPGSPESMAGSPGGFGSTRHRRESEPRTPTRHSAEVANHDTGMTPAAPTFTVSPGTAPPPAARHRSADAGSHTDAASTGEQSAANLLARLQTTSTGGRRRRRHQEDE